MNINLGPNDADLMYTLNWTDVKMRSKTCHRQSEMPKNNKNKKKKLLPSLADRKLFSAVLLSCTPPAALYCKSEMV